MKRPERIASIDAFRGFVMLLMLAQVLHTCVVAASLRAASAPSGLWDFLCYSQSHVPWTGASIDDMIQPGFSFLVGVAVPLSMAGRLGKGQSKQRLFLHALWRSFVLVALGVGLRGLWTRKIVWTLEDTLTQIGLGYPFLFLLAFTRPRVQKIALGALLFAVWLAFVLYPLPGPGFDYTAVGVPPEFLRDHELTGLAAHFQKNSNLGWAVDRALLNLFPRPSPFYFNEGGYTTISFLPTLGTMLLGLLSYRVVSADRPRADRGRALTAWGLLCIVLGLGLDALGVCPIIKRLWTPAFVLYSGGYCLLFFAAFFALIDVLGYQRWALPLRVLGANSLLAYLLHQISDGVFVKRFTMYLGHGPFAWAGAPYEPFIVGSTVLLVYWVFLYILFQKRLFLKL